MNILLRVPKLADEFPNPKLNNFPHVVERIDLFWGEVEFLSYLTKLLIQNVARQGFPDEVIRELSRISEIHSEEFPKLDPTLQRTPFVTA